MLLVGSVAMLLGPAGLTLSTMFRSARTAPWTKRLLFCGVVVVPVQVTGFWSSDDGWLRRSSRHQQFAVETPVAPARVSRQAQHHAPDGAHSRPTIGSAPASTVVPADST